MTLNQIYYFKKTAQFSHMARAAKELMISQPSLSISISKLENELGVALFEKNGRGITLTKAGHVFLSHANKIIGKVENAKLEMSQLRQCQLNNINIAYINPLGKNFIPRLLASFMRKEENSHILVNSIEMTTSRMAGLIERDLCDIGFCSEINNSLNFIQIPIIEQPIVLIVPCNHPLTQCGNKVLKIKDILSYPFISYCNGSPMNDVIRLYFDSYNCLPNVCHRTSSESSISTLVAEGLGIAIVAQTDNLDQDKITIMKLEGLTMKRKIYMTYRKYRKQSKLIKELIECTKNQIIKEENS